LVHQHDSRSGLILQSGGRVRRVLGKPNPERVAPGMKIRAKKMPEWVEVRIDFISEQQQFNPLFYEVSGIRIRS
jgi:hypothetical protein